MRRRTAIKNLRSLTELCRGAVFPGEDGPLLLEVYAYGEVLNPAIDDLDVVHVAGVLNLPADEVTWWAFPPECTALVHMLRIDRTPVLAHWRPSVWPIWNHVIRRPIRIWSHETGPDEQAITALSNGDADQFHLVAPSSEEEREQLATELDASLAHLRRVRDSYHEPGWRRAHKGFGVYPEDHLWRAVHGYIDLLDAVRAADERP